MMIYSTEKPVSLQQLLHEVQLYVQHDETAPFYFSEKAEYDFFRSWAISHPKSQNRASSPPSIPTPSQAALPSTIAPPHPPSRETLSHDRPQPKIIERKVYSEQSKPVHLVAPSIPSSSSVEDFKQLFRKIAPHIAFVEEVPSDRKAEQLNRRWQTKSQAAPLSLFYMQESEPERLFLGRIQIALSTSWAPATLISAASIEQEDQWETFLLAPELKGMILSESTLWQLPRLIRFYTENPTQGTRSLGKVPLLLLSNLSMYLNNPSLKRSLWNLLCQTVPRFLSS